MVKIVLVTALISFVAFYVLGLLSRRWLSIRARSSCEHDWQLLLEKYPTFAQNRWQCGKCNLTEDFAHGASPVATKLSVCDMGHAHTVVTSEWDEWPDTIYDVSRPAAQGKGERG